MKIHNHYFNSGFSTVPNRSVFFGNEAPPGPLGPEQQAEPNMVETPEAKFSRLSKHYEETRQDAVKTLQAVVNDATADSTAKMLAEAALAAVEKTKKPTEFINAQVSMELLKQNLGRLYLILGEEPPDFDNPRDKIVPPRYEWFRGEPKSLDNLLNDDNVLNKVQEDLKAGHMPSKDNINVLWTRYLGLKDEGDKPTNAAKKIVIDEKAAAVFKIASQASDLFEKSAEANSPQYKQESARLNALTADSNTPKEQFDQQRKVVETMGYQFEVKNNLESNKILINKVQEDLRSGNIPRIADVTALWDKYSAMKDGEAKIGDMPELLKQMQEQEQQMFKLAEKAGREFDRNAARVSPEYRAAMAKEEQLSRASEAALKIFEQKRYDPTISQQEREKVGDSYLAVYNAWQDQVNVRQNLATRVDQKMHEPKQDTGPANTVNNRPAATLAQDSSIDTGPSRAAPAKPAGGPDKAPEPGPKQKDQQELASIREQIGVLWGKLNQAKATEASRTTKFKAADNAQQKAEGEVARLQTAMYAEKDLAKLAALTVELTLASTNLIKAQQNFEAATKAMADSIESRKAGEKALKVEEERAVALQKKIDDPDSYKKP